MFGLWRKIAEKGSVAILLRAEALSLLEWAEVSEHYPELVPEACRGYNVYCDDGLMRGCPFVREGNAYKFVAEDPILGEGLDVFVNSRDLLNMLCAKDYVGAEESLFAGVLTCSCGIPDCDGIGEQSVHVSEQMVRWDVCRYSRRYTLFFEREAYDQGVVRMLYDLCQEDNGIDYAIGGGCENRALIVEGMRDALIRHPYYAEIWDERGSAAL